MDARQMRTTRHTLERHTDTNKLTGHTASWAATHPVPEWAYTSLKATFPLPPPPALAVPGVKQQQTNTDKRQGPTREAEGLLRL